VTGNRHKIEEVQTIFEKYCPEFQIMQADIPLLELQATTLEEVAAFKIQSVMEKIDPPYFIEDAGFFVDDVCQGFPGVYSSYVMKTIGWDGILKIMAGKTDRNAHFESVIAYIDKKKAVHYFKGVNEGQVSTEARGTSGFGFDPIFMSNETPNRTFAELGLHEKNSISHRRRAVNKFIEFLKKSVLNV
jgi:XTP/dITP diphosphohydrolase